MTMTEKYCRALILICYSMYEWHSVLRIESMSSLLSFLWCPATPYTLSTMVIYALKEAECTNLIQSQSDKTA